MKKFKIELEVEENGDHTAPIYLVQDVCEALLNFSDVNLSWSKINSVSCEGIKCSSGKDSLIIGADK